MWPQSNYRMKPEDDLSPKDDRPVAVSDMPCTSRAIKGRLRRGFVVECLTYMASTPNWRRVGEVVNNEPPHFYGLWVREHGGVRAYFRPVAARFRVMQEGEST